MNRSWIAIQLGALALTPVSLSSCSDEKSEEHTVTCDFDGKFEGEVSVRSQQDNYNLCEAQTQTRTFENGQLDFVKTTHRDAILVWIESNDDGEVWKIVFSQDRCELALPYLPSCVDTSADAGTD